MNPSFSLRATLLASAFCVVACGGKSSDPVLSVNDLGSSSDSGQVQRPDTNAARTDSGPVVRPDAHEFASCTANVECEVPLVCRVLSGLGSVCVPQCRVDTDCCDDPSAPCGRTCTADGACVVAGAETCNGHDDDRDGEVDEDFDLNTNVAHCGACGNACDAALANVRSGGTTCSSGLCQIADQGCADGFSDINGTPSDGCEYACLVTMNGVELPDGIDNDCNGAVDEGLSCTQSESPRPCGSSTGVCEEGSQFCRADGMWTECRDTVGPSEEKCNGLDDDCDGAVDETFYLDVPCVGQGSCGLGEYECDGELSFQCSTNPGGSDYPDPAPEEVCDDLVDNDCDGSVDEDCGDCVPESQRPCGSLAHHGIGVCRLGIQACSADRTWGECANAVDPAPGELCNGTDDDCDSVVPLNELDADRDGFSECDGDCDDSDPERHPQAVETCDGVDNDCDDVVDEDFFVGVPCEGVGSCSSGLLECAADGEGVQCSTDPGGSNDQSGYEGCNGIDDDCNGVIDDVSDVELQSPDNCGACGRSCVIPNGSAVCVEGMCEVRSCIEDFNLVDGVCFSCPGGPRGESCDADGVDEDCDGLVNEDCACVDGETPRICGVDPSLDGVGICRLGFQRCDSGDWLDCQRAVVPVDEQCNGLDDDCDGFVPTDEADADGDGFAPCAEDCDDSNPELHPQAVEVCDGIDNNCNGIVDEGFFIGAPCDGVGECGPGRIECYALGTGTWCSTDVGGSEFPNPAPVEICGNNLDENCNRALDDGCETCAAGAFRTCSANPELHGVGVCLAGGQVCGSDGVWGTCSGSQDPYDEGPCPDSLDNDCDGETDEDGFLDSDVANCGECFNNCLGADRNVLEATCESTCNQLVCRPGWFDLNGDGNDGCEYGCFPTNGGVEQCDSIDNDCDGMTDESEDGESSLCGEPTEEPPPCSDVDSDNDSFSECTGDCADDNPDFFPGAPETCNDRDNDCNGFVDDGIVCP
jgi:hypothetical protein